MARPHVPKFGQWDSGDKVPYTVYFEKAREGRTTGKIVNPNDPEESPELFTKIPPQNQPKKPTLPKLINEPEEPIVRGPVRPSHGRITSRENGDFKPFSESPGRRENVGGRGGNNVRPVRQSVGNEFNIEKSPINPKYQGKVAAASRVGGSSPAWDGKSSYDSSHGTPERSRMRPRGRDSPVRGVAVPKFGEWDEKKASSGDGYTQIFNKVREERQTGPPKSPNDMIHEPTSAPRHKYDDDDLKTCCFPWGRK